MESPTLAKFVSCPVWNQLLNDWANSEDGKYVRDYVKEERTKHTVYPQPNQLFRAFDLCHFDKVKVVIIGQDPYHNGVADGLSFSVNGHNASPSLKVIMEEVMRTEWPHNTISQVFPVYKLDKWAEQGVLLLNTALSVRKGAAGSHKNIGWQSLVDEVIKALKNKPHPIVWMLWGKDAQALEPALPETDLILRAPHPQAQNYNPSMKFVGCNHFKTTNNFLLEQTRKGGNRQQLLQINWSTF